MPIEFCNKNERLTARLRAKEVNNYGDAVNCIKKHLLLPKFPGAKIPAIEKKFGGAILSGKLATFAEFWFVTR